MAIENKNFNSEADLALRTYKVVGPSPVLIGSTSVKLELPLSDSPFLKKPNDLDVIMDGNEIDSFAKTNGLAISRTSLIDVRSETFGTDDPKVKEVKSPLKVIGVTGGDGRFGFLEKVDFFTQETGVGVIPVEKAMKLYHKSKINGTEMKMPEKGFQLATYLNPIAVSETRGARSLYLLMNEFKSESKESFRDTMSVLMSYIRDGGVRAQEIAEQEREKGNVRKDFESYPEGVRKVGFYLKTNLKSNARNIAKRVGVPEFDAALKAITRPLESYSQKEKLSVT